MIYHDYMADALAYSLREAYAHEGQQLAKWMAQRHLYEGHEGAYTPMCRRCFPRATWRQRLRWWWRDHRPHVHLGPCPQEDAW